MLATEQLRNLLALHRTPDIGPRWAHKLLAHFTTAEEILHANISLLNTLGLSEKSILALKNPDWKAVDRDLEWAAQNGHAILEFSNDNYPTLLKETINPPIVLFVKGDISILNDPQLAIVGSRNPTPTGRENAHTFAKNLAEVGMTITSGLALGIDAASHQGALDGMGRTIAVMGTGLDHLYPQRNIKLAEKIVANNGALISEFPLGVSPMPANFPQRNRIISGLSLGTLVVEAALKSGSLITARFALEQGREVFAIPGSIHNPLSRGCHGLLRQGAKLVESVSDILEEFLPFITNPNNSHTSSEIQTSQLNKLDYSLQKLLNCVGYETTSMETLLERSDLTISELTTLLVSLEMSGHIKTVPGGYAKNMLKN